MSIIDRFTRDDVSAKVWWPLALLLLVLFVLTFPGQNVAVQREREAAAAWVDSAVDDMAATLSSAHLDEPLGDAAAGPILASAADTILAHPLVASVRVWNPDGRLLLSSDAADSIGSAEYLNDESIAAAVSAAGTPSWGVSTASLSDVPGPPTLEVFMAVAGADGTTGVVEVRIPDGPMLSDVRGIWRGYRLVFGLAGALLFLLAGLSMRDPVAPMGAGVRFYRESLPPNLAVMDRDEEVELRQAGAVARSRVEGMEGRLRESEEARLVLEGKLQTALSELAMRPRRKAPVRSVKRKPEPVVAPEPEPVVVPEPEPIAAEPEPESAVVPEPEPVAMLEPEPVVVADPEADEVIVNPEPEAVSANGQEDTSVGADWLLELEVEAKQEPAIDEKVVVIPEASDHEESAVEVLNRLVEPVGAGVVPEADPGEMRSRLARTAALKKPGSRSEERFRDMPAGNGKPES